MLDIRPAHAGDAPAIARYIVMAEGEMVRFFTGFDEPEDAGAAMEAFIQSPAPCRYSPEFALVAEAERRPAGALIAFPADRQEELDKVVLEALHRRGMALPRLTAEGEPGTFYLSTMGVNSDFRGRGIGTALMAAAEKRGRELGFSRTSLLVSPSKERAQALYERLGYAVIGETSIGGYAYRRMTKTL